jgi:predicted nucleotidyltransferase
MNLSKLREGELKEIFDPLEEAFSATGVDFYIIGALAKYIWYAMGDVDSGQTKDVDFAVLVGSNEDYEAIKNYLKDNKNFEDSKENAFVLFSPSGMQVDILPFGTIEIDDSVTLAGGSLNSTKVNGFQEVYQSGTEDVLLETGHHFNVATLPSIVLLKFIAFDDRPEVRTKDARDIADIIHHFFDLQPDVIYDEHSDLFINDSEDTTLQEISAIVIGREIKKIIASNVALSKRIQSILKVHIDKKEESTFVKNMVAQSGSTVEQIVLQLKNILDSVANDA